MAATKITFKCTMFPLTAGKKIETNTPTDKFDKASDSLSICLSLSWGITYYS